MGSGPNAVLPMPLRKCFIVLARKHSTIWILEGDKACFDRISHLWLNEHIPMDEHTLRKWLAAGYMEEGVVYPTEAGRPQGGVASPVLANMTLDGLEEVAQRAVPRNQKVHVVKYTDDFVITGASKEVLEDDYRDAVRRELGAYYRHIPQIGLIMQRLVQYLAVIYPCLVWSWFRSWLRTIRSGLPPSELVTTAALRHSLPDFLAQRQTVPLFKQFLRENIDVANYSALRLAG